MGDAHGSSRAGYPLKTYDAIVAGNGPAGSVAGLLLARAGYSVLQVGQSVSLRKIGESLPGAARPLLLHLGLQDILASDAHEPCCANASAWGSDRLQITDEIHDQHGLGWHLDRERFDRDLQSAALRAGVEAKTAIIQSVTLDKDRWRVQAAGEEFTAHVLADATGRGASVARELGAKVQKDDELLAVYAWLPCAENENDLRTVIEAQSDGWWYSARLPGQTRVVAYHSDIKNVREWLNHPGVWLEKLLLTRHLAKFAVKGPLKLHCRPAGSARLSRFSGRNWLAMGDAALAFDPLSSQGIYNALYTGLRGGEALVAHLRGNQTAFSQYEDHLESIYQTYRRNQQRFYAREQRWLDQPFWRNRQGTAFLF